ncbi:unnamed protein product, partial [Darwinula stevensoni]
CGGTITGLTHGAINSPGYPGRYPHDRDCTWIVSVPLNMRLQLVFATLRIEHHANCSYDFIQIRDGVNEHSHVLSTICGTPEHLPAPLSTSGPHAWIYFHSDGYENDMGFHVSWLTVPGIPGCGGLLTQARGGFAPPSRTDLQNLVASYEHNLDCEWVVRAPMGERVRLTFASFRLEGSAACFFDYVEVREGSSPDGPLVYRRCGDDLPPSHISRGNELLVHFHSDYSVAHEGFQAHYEIGLC